MNNFSSNRFVTFYVWNKQVYCLELNGTLVKTSLSSRRFLFKNIIKSAELDLKDKPNGKWCFSSKTGWIKIPMSFAELIQLPATELEIKLNTRMNPVLPVLVDSDFYRQITNDKKKGFSKQPTKNTSYVLVEFFSNPRRIKIVQ